MILLEPTIPTAQEEHELALWTRAECYRFYVAQRRANCTYVELMNLWLRAPYCDQCIVSHPFYSGQLPDISGHFWDDDIRSQLGEDMLIQIKDELSADSSFSFCCKRCQNNLAPWERDDIYIVMYHLEEHYGIPLETPGHMEAAKKMQNQVLRLYGSVCFACGESGPGLHIDHIRPRSLGGDAAFRNLQPLCGSCGQRKGQRQPDEVDVYSDIYFGRYPSDGYEGLFW